MEGAYLRMSLKFTQQKLVPICLSNFRHDLHIVLMPQTFKGFNDLYAKAHDIEIYQNKRKKSVKESVLGTGVWS